MDAFRKARIEPNVVFGSVDADVSKTYVELGLGIPILTTITYSGQHDRALRARDASHLFEPSITYVRLRANTYLRKFLLDFIRMLAPHLGEDEIRAAITKDIRGKP